MNKLFEGPEFVPEAVRYGEAAVMVFVALLFSSGLPLLYPTLALTLLIQYWVDKYQLLKVCKNPEPQSHALATSMSAAVPYACLLHCGFAIAAFALFPMERSALADSPAVGPYVTGLVSAIQNGLARHAEVKLIKLLLLQRHTILFFLSLLLMALVLLVAATWRLWGWAFKAVGRLVLGPEEDGEDEEEGGGGDEEEGGARGRGAMAGAAAAPSFDEAVAAGTLEGIESYAIESNPKYALAFRKVAWMHIFQHGVRNAGAGAGGPSDNPLGPGEQQPPATPARA